MCSFPIDVHLLFPRKNRYSLGVVVLVIIHFGHLPAAVLEEFPFWGFKQVNRTCMTTRNLLLFLITMQESLKIGQSLQRAFFRQILAILGYHDLSGRRLEGIASLSFHWPYIPLWNQINTYRLIKWTCTLPISEFSVGHDSILRWQHPVEKNKDQWIWPFWHQWIWPFWPLLRILPHCILHFKFHFATKLIF